MAKRTAQNQTQNTLSDHTKDRSGNPGVNYDNLLAASLAAYAEAGFPPGSAGARAVDKLVARHASRR